MAIPAPNTPQSGSPQRQPRFDQAIDSKRFRSALGSFPTGVAIITTVGLQGQPVGLTCNSFSSISLDPPLVGWSLRLASKSIDVFRGAPGFAINVLHEDQTELSARFASSTMPGKFDGVAHAPGYLGLPVLAGCVASFQCRTFAQHPAGDHLMFIGQVETFEHVGEAPSLVFYRGGYAALAQSLQALSASGRIDPAELEAARDHLHGVLLRLACEQGQEQDFAAIEQNIRLMESYPEADMDKRSANARQFFDLIAAAARNEVLSVVARSLTTLLHHTLTTRIPLVARPALLPVRWQILQALRARDATACTAAMSCYFSAFRTDLARAALASAS